MLYALSTVIADSGGHMFDNDWSGGWWILMMVGMIVFWALIILGGAWVVRSVILSRREPTERPIEILDRRFAQGEIDEDEYQKRRSALESRSGPGG